MILPDVNVLVGVLQPDAINHNACLTWLRSLQSNAEPYAVSTTILASVTRVATNPKAFAVPATLKEAIDFCTALLSDPCCRRIEPGPQHFLLFSSLCIAANARGNLVSDAWLAALALEHGCTVVTLDSDFRKFPGLSVSSPLIAG